MLDLTLFWQTYWREIEWLLLILSAVFALIAFWLMLLNKRDESIDFLDDEDNYID